MDTEILKEFLDKFCENSHTEQEHEFFINWVQMNPIEEVFKVMENFNCNRKLN